MQGPRKHWRRRGVAEWLVSQLLGEKPTLVGIDHAFSFPRRYFEKYGLPLDWHKFLDDLELQREQEVKLPVKKFKPAIEPPYRWRDWAAQSGVVAGAELLPLINQEERTLPNAEKGAGLFRCLRTLSSCNPAKET